MRQTRIGDVLSLERKPVLIDTTREYTFLGISANGGGFFRKSPVSGASVRPGSAFGIEPGAFVYSRLFAWQGSFEIASCGDTGCVVSGEFPTFRVDDNRVDARWLRFWLLSDAGRRAVDDRSAGSTPGSRKRLREDRFLDIPIRLPPLDEQRRVADLLGRVADRSIMVRARYDRARQLSTALAVSSVARPDLGDAIKMIKGWRKLCLGQVMTPSRDAVSVDTSKSYPNVGIYSYGRGLFAKPEIVGARTSAMVLNRIKTGQFIYSRLFAFEGAYSFVEPSFDGAFVSNEFPCFDADPAQLNAKWLATYIGTADRWAELAGSSKGLGVRRQRVPVDAVLAFEVWLPPLSEQNQMVAVVERLDRAADLRSSAQVRASSLVPAALNQAFAGLS